MGATSFDQAIVWPDAASQPHFDVMNEGEELVIEPFERLIERARRRRGQLRRVRAEDTFKRKVQLDAIAASDSPPWQVWSH